MAETREKHTIQVKISRTIGNMYKGISKSTWPHPENATKIEKEKDYTCTIF